MLGNRRLAAAAGTALLTASLAGCSSGGGPTIAQATRAGAAHLDALSTALVEHEQVTVPWHASSTTSAGVGCATGEQRWIGVGTVTVKAANSDGDSPPTRLVAVLQNAGWEAGASAGDLDQDPATMVPAVLRGRNPDGFRLDVTIERAADAWHYVVAASSGCAAKD